MNAMVPPTSAFRYFPQMDQVSRLNALKNVCSEKSRPGFSCCLFAPWGPSAERCFSCKWSAHLPVQPALLEREIALVTLCSLCSQRTLGSLTGDGVHTYDHVLVLNILLIISINFSKSFSNSDLVLAAGGEILDRTVWAKATQMLPMSTSCNSPGVGGQDCIAWGI